jgi:polar amino acid transport system permease protein
VLLSGVPFLVIAFFMNEGYSRALAFILPGVGVTILAAVAAYAAAAVLGLLLAALLALQPGRYVHGVTFTLGVAAGIAAVVAFTRPQETVVLIGAVDVGARVAFVQGTPSALADALRSGAYGGPALTVRSVDSSETATLRLRDGAVTAALLPQAAVPIGVSEVWRTSFLAPATARAGVAAAVLAFVAVALAIAGAWAKQHPLAILAEMYVDALRGVPMLVVILYVGFPLQGALREMSGGVIDLSRLTRGIVALALGYAAYLAEIFRAGIEAVPRGQREAARSLGLNSVQTARFVVLPQALRIVIPPLGNEFIALLKDTALLSILSVRDVTQRAREFQAGTFLTFPPYNTVALIYIALTLAAASLVKWIERRTAWGGR